MGKVKKADKPVGAKHPVLSKDNKISKGKSNTKKTLKDQILKNLGVKEPKKALLKTDQKKLAAIVQKNSSVKVTKKSKSVLQNGTTKKSEVETKKGIKRKQNTVEDTSGSGKYVLAAKKSKESPEKQEANQSTKRLETKFKIDESAVKTAFKGLQKVLEEEAKRHNKLFDDDQPIFLQVTSVKVPKCPPRVARLPLKHSIFADGGDICFIAVDVPNTELEEAKEHYETLFTNKGICNIKTVIPLRQLKAEYGEFELKRRLVELYDVFLVDGRISGKVSRMLGNIFYQKRKLPVPIKFHEGKLQRNIKKALLRTPFHIHPKGDTFIVQVCHSGMTEEQKIANFWSVLQGIDKEFPGHWENVRSLHLKGTNTIAVPVYLNLISKNEVKTPVIKSKRPKAFVPVSDELSTKINHKVTVHPTGDVETEMLKVKQDSVEIHSDEETDDSADEDDDGYADGKATKKQGGKKVKKDEKEVAENTDNDEESDVEYTQEELSYLQEMQSNKKKAPVVKNKKLKQQKPANKKNEAKRKGNKNKIVKRNKK